DDIIKKIQNIKNGEFLPKITLQSNSVYTGKQKLDGTEYNVALYSRKASLTNLQKVVVKDVADLRSNFHALKKPLFCESSYKNYLVIACYEKDEEEPSLIIQATQSKGHDIFSETQLKAWMHYLGILVDVRDIRLENVRWISQFSSEINGRPCHWCGTSGTCCNGGTACTTCPKDSTNTKKCCMETCSTDTLTTCDSCTNQQICNTRACKSNSCCYYTALTMIEQFGVTTNLNQKEDIATLISNSNWKKQSDLKVNIQNFIWSVAYIDSILKLGKPVLIGVHYDNDYPHPYNDNKATFHYMVIVGKTYKYDKEYYMFYDPGREFINQAKATSETNLLEVDRNKNMIHGTYKENPYTITEVRKNL
ncbi:MAG: hypothetical protein LBD59_01045, partial [Prevotellaceae bacterium]|nr:hypothetical protein [Prevotellaceae bacterium]